MKNIPSFPDQVSNGRPPQGVSDVVGLYLNNPKVKQESLSGLLVALDYATAFHELAEAYEKIDGGKKTYAAGHNAALDRELKLRAQRPYLKWTNTGAGGVANGRSEGQLVIKR